MLVLVTTNEEVRTLHRAVARPGRCAANVQFQPLTRDEVAEWLHARGVEAPVEDERALASLYAVAQGLDPPRPADRRGRAHARMARCRLPSVSA